MRILCISILLVAFGCSGSTGEPRTSQAAETRETAEREDTPRPAIDPSTACGRALACCRAYANAIPDVVERSACSGVYEALDGPDPDRRCRLMTAGWRDALVHLSGSAPEECPR